MRTIALVACAKTKADKPSPAADLYKSALFEKTKIYAQNHADRWFILSAKHGLLDPTTVIEPYDKTLKTSSRRERAEWSSKVLDQLMRHLTRGDRVILLAGKDYREFLDESLKSRGFNVQIPLEGVSLGRQLQTLDRLNAGTDGNEYVEQFYNLLKILSIGLKGARLLRDCQASSGWPNRGVYFLFEPHETRRSNQTENRVIRVGTHAVSKNSKSTLWGRLATHRGTYAGGGSHRSSVFRLHVGTAMISRSQGKLLIPTWGHGQNAPKEIRDRESALEAQVTKFMEEIRVLWLNVPDEPGPNSDRSFVERNCIALLSNQTLNMDSPSDSWLGLFSLKKQIRESGLWNVNYVGEKFDNRLFRVLEQYIEVTVGQRSVPSHRLAPQDWYQALRKRSNSQQLTLI